MKQKLSILILVLFGLVSVWTIAKARINNPESANTFITSGPGTAGSVIFHDGTQFAQDNSNLFWDDTNNRLGIASTSPFGLLSVNPNGLGAGVPSFVVGSSTATNFVIYNGGNSVFNENGGDADFRIEGDSAGTFAGSPANLFVVDASQTNVGIGTAPTAGALLDVGGGNALTANNPIILRLGGDMTAADANSSESLRVTAIHRAPSGRTIDTYQINIPSFTTSSSGGTFDDVYGIYVGGPEAAVSKNYGIYIPDRTVGTVSDYGIYVVGADTAAAYFGSNVGIGTTTPFSRLQVSNGASATSTVTIGEIGLSTSRGCVNMNRPNGSDASFYINNAGTAFVVEPNYCK